MRRPQGGSSSSSSRQRTGPQLVSGTLYGAETFDPLQLLTQLLLLLSCFYVLLCLFSFAALTVLQQRQLTSNHALQPDLLLLERKEQQQQPVVSSPTPVEGAAAAGAAAAATAGKTAQAPVSRRVSLLFSSGNPSTSKETAAALDAAMLLTGALLSLFLYWVVRRSRKVIDFCCSLGLLHVVACTVASGFPTRSGFWVSLASSGCLCGALAFCLCRRAESKPIVFRSAGGGSPLCKGSTAAAAAEAVELQPMQHHEQQQEEQQMLLAVETA